MSQATLPLTEQTGAQLRRVVRDFIARRVADREPPRTSPRTYCSRPTGRAPTAGPSTTSPRGCTASPATPSSTTTAAWSVIPFRTRCRLIPSWLKTTGTRARFTSWRRACVPWSPTSNRSTGKPSPSFTRKGGRAAKAVLARPTEAAVSACIGDRRTGPLFLNRAGHRMDQPAAQRFLDRAAHHLHGRHPRVTPHVPRHSWTTLAIDAGVPQDQIQHDGGWADARMVSYYTHGRDQALRAATHSVAAYVLSAA